VKQDFNKILDQIGFVDKIIFGRLNYNKMVTSYNEKEVFYNDLTKTVVDFCIKNSKQYHIKEGTYCGQEQQEIITSNILDYSLAAI
jgi:hypothetical protein